MRPALRCLLLAAPVFLAGQPAPEQPPALYRTLPRLIWVVDDAAKIAAAWERTGVPTENTGPLRTACFDNVQAHWIQPKPGDGEFGKFLKTRGSGVMALGYVAPSAQAVEMEKARLAALGVRVLEEGRWPAGGGRQVAYTLFDTAQQGKIVLALLTDSAPGCAGRRGPTVTQFALTSRNLDAVSAYWARLGFPAFQFTQPDLTDRRYRGTPADFAMRLGWQRHLKVPFEWIEPLRGKNVYDDHVAKHGEGFHHIAFNVPDMDEAIARWTALGYPESMSGGWGVKDTPGSGRFAYHDLHTAGGIDIELLWNYRAPEALAAPKPFALRFSRGEALPEHRIPVADLGWPQDWRKWKAVRFDFLASSLEAFSFGFSDGAKVKSMVMEPLPGLKMRAVIPFDAFYQTRQMVPLNPLGYKAWPERLFTFEKVTELVVRMKQPATDATLEISNLALVAGEERDALLDPRPVIDRFGQWMPESWPGKAGSIEQLRTMWEQDKPSQPPASWCPLGGDPSRTMRKTGFFRTEKIGERWYLVDPHGHPFFSAGMDLVNLKQGSFATRVTGREALFERLPPPGPAWLTPGKDVSFHLANVMDRHGSAYEENWAAHTVGRLKGWGFNTIANWSDAELAAHSGMPYVLPLSGWTTKRTFPFPWDFPDVFSEEFERNVDEAARKQCAPRKDDPNLIGWFLGNEPHWAREFGSLKPWAEMLLEDPEDSATRRELRKMLAAKPGEAAAIKRDFVYTCARKYFETIVRAVRRHDPNHLVLGIRYAGNPDDEWIRMSAMFDAFSINIYDDAYAPRAERLDRYARLSGRPILIGEFTACAPGRGLQGLFYWVHKVRDQAERGKAYRYYVENAAAHPAMIGTHWFQLVDDLPTGRPSDDERLNYGFLNVLDLPYPELVEAARETHWRLYDVKSGKAAPFAQKPEPF